MLPRNRNSGFITLPITAWAALGAFVVIALLGIALKVQTSRLESVKAEYAGFVAQVKAVGEAQEAKTKEKDAENAKRKQEADVQNARSRRDLAVLYDAYGKLRDSRTRSSFLPEAPGTAGSPASATFDRAALDRALRTADEGITGLLAEGDAAIVDLDSAKAWAKGR